MLNNELDVEQGREIGELILKDVKEVIKRSKNRKAFECDNTNIKLIKYGREKMHTPICDLIKYK